MTARAPTPASRRAGARAPSAGGFTLMEVIVALAILAIALMAALRSSTMATQNAGDIRLRLLADWVAQDRLEEHRARRDWLPFGSQSGEIAQGGARFRWDEKIIGTPNARFRRIEVRVYQADGSDPNHALTQFTGFLVQPGG